MAQEVGYVHEDFCVLLWVLLTSFVSPVGCRLSAGCLHPCLGHLNCANCVLQCESREGRNLCPGQAAKLELFEKASLFLGCLFFFLRRLLWFWLGFFLLLVGLFVCFNVEYPLLERGSSCCSF